MKFLLKHIENTIKNSFWLQCLKHNLGTIVMSSFAATFICILSYPGVLYSDSYERISLANAIPKIMSDNFSNVNLSFRLTPTPSLFILLSKEITGSIVLYTFIQSFLHFFISIIFADKLNAHKHILWNRLFVFLCPVICGYSVYYEASVGCISSILVMILLIWKWNDLNTVFDRFISIIFLIFSAFVCFGYRTNSLTIIPVIFLIVFLKERKLLYRCILVSTVCIGFFTAILWPKLLRIDTVASYIAGPAWEIVSTIQLMDSHTKSIYSAYLDDIFGDGITKQAIEKNLFNTQDSSINAILWDTLDIYKMSSKGVPTLIFKKYINLFFEQPKYFLKMKFEFISHSLGIGKKLNFWEWNYNRWDRMDEFRFNDSVQRKAFVDFVQKFVDYVSIFKTPWFLYAFCFVLIALYRCKYVGRHSSLNLYEYSYLFSVFYYLAFILNTQSFEFRYFYPSWLLLFLIIVTISREMLNKKFVFHIRICECLKRR